MKSINDHGREIRMIPVGQLHVVWPESQRTRRDAKVEGMKQDFHGDRVGVLVVCQPNGAGTYHMVDGQHRHKLLMDLFGPKYEVPCIVLPGKTPREAARAWRGINSGRTMPQAVDDFLAAVTGEYEDEVAVNEIIHEHGYRVAPAGGDGTISAVVACMTVYRSQGGDVLDWTLDTIKKTWGKDRDAVHGAILRGYAALVSDHPSVNQSRLVDRVTKEYTAPRLLGAAKTARSMFKGTLHSNVVRILVQTYNHGLRTGPRLGEEA